MRILYHVWAIPACRIIRLALAEKGLEFEPRVERVWEQRPEFLEISPMGEVPLLVEPDGTTLTDAWVISEYLEETYGDTPLLGTTPLDRAETRRLLVWFDQRFSREVSENLVGEKLLKRFLGGGQPSSEAIRTGLANIRFHMDYIGFLAERRRWLAGDALSMADLAAASHLSLVDYLGNVPWDDHPETKNWYARIKSRPSFRPLLLDAIPGVPPPPHYADLDF